MKIIREAFLRNRIEISFEQAEKLSLYRDILIEENEKFNLTAITDYEEIAVKHFVDSCMGGKHLSNNSTVIDIGSGAGFPAIPLKILNPSLKFCLLDALNKRVEFLKHLVRELNLENMECIHSRAEDYAVCNRDKYDFAVARAVSSLSTLCEYSLPLLKKGGKLIAYKGDKAEEEAKSADNALKILGGKIIEIENFLLNNENKRSFIIVEKNLPTPLKYPRKQNRPKNNPL